MPTGWVIFLVHRLRLLEIGKEGNHNNFLIMLLLKTLIRSTQQTSLVPKTEGLLQQHAYFQIIKNIGGFRFVTAIKYLHVSFLQTSKERQNRVAMKLLV